MTRSIRWALLVLLASAPAMAAPVTVTGTFTSFTSWMFEPSVQQTLVNGTPLTSSGVVVGTNGAVDLYQSNLLSFTGPTPQVEFRYDWVSAGSAQANMLEWIPNPVDIGPSIPTAPFTLGTLRFRNGFYFRLADIGIRLETVSPNATLNGAIYEGTIRVVSTAPDDLTDYDAQADYFFFVGTSVSGRVFDLCCQPPANPGSVGDFHVVGHIASLHVDGLVAASPAGFTNPSTTDALQPNVPEPASLVLLGLAVIGVAGRQRFAGRLVGGDWLCPQRRG